MKNIRVLNGVSCISCNALSEAIGSVGYVKKALCVSRKNGSTSWTHYPDPDDARKKWVVIKSLPTATRKKVEAHLVDLDFAPTNQKFIDSLQAHIDLTDHEVFLLEFDQDRSIRKVHSAAFLRMLSNGSLRDQFKTDAEYYSNAVRFALNHDLIDLKISNHQVLKRKVHQFRSESIGCLIHGGTGNDNSAKVKKDGKEWITKIYGSPLKPSYRKVAEVYNTEANQREGWQPITEDCVASILHKPFIEQVTSLHRHGGNVTRNKFERTVKREKPSRPDALWAFDGYTIQLRYRMGKEIKSDLYAIAVFDVYSSRVLGMRLGQAETTTLVQGALRAACMRNMQRPEQLQYDNSSANKAAETRDLLKRIGALAFPTAPYNGKSKTIEAIWGHIERIVMHALPNFKGGNITSHSLEIKANPDYLSQIDLPDLSTTIGLVDLVMRTWNARKGDDGRSPDERYQDFKDQRQVLSFQQMVEAFWVERKNPARYTKNGLTIEVNKRKYTYEVESERGIEDMEWRLHNLGTSFSIKYNPDQLDKIALYKDGVFITMANRKYEAPMARIDFEEGDGSILSKALSERKRYLKTLRDEMDTIDEHLENVGLPTEIDFHLLHKDAFNRMEGSVLDDQIDGSAMDLNKLLTPVSKKKRFDNLYNIDEDEDCQIIGPADF